MAVFQCPPDFERLDPAVLEAWKAIPTAIASDCLNRAQTMTASVKSVEPGRTLCAQARTVQVIVGDNGAIHAAMRTIESDQALVVDAGGYLDTAVWGGLLTRQAMALGVAGAIIDGATRDVAEIRELGFACFAAGIAPAGPHKAFVGKIDAPIACGGCSVSSGDIVLGDDDGVTIVPLARHVEILAAAQEKIAAEEAMIERLEAGELLADQLGVPAVTAVGHD